MPELWKPNRRQLIRAGGLIVAPAILRQAQAGCGTSITLTGAGCAPSAAASYVGPLDVIGSGASGWGGLRGYSAAYAAPGTNPSIDVVDQAGANSLTANILANGNLDVASINTWVTAHSVTTIYIQKLYDQTGGGKHFTVVGSFFNGPQLTLNAIGSLPSMTFNAANTQRLATSATFTILQPLTYSVVAETSSVSAQSLLIDSGNQVQLNFTTTTAGIFAGLLVSAAASLNNFHALQGIFDQAGAGSSIYIDGASTTGNASNQNISGSPLYIGGLSSGIQLLTGDISEVGVWPIAFNSTQYAAMNGNQRSYWGF